MPMPFSEIRKDGDMYRAVMTLATHNDRGVISGYSRENVTVPIHQPRPANSNGCMGFGADGKGFVCAGFRSRDGSSLDPDYMRFRAKLTFKGRAHGH